MTYSFFESEPKFIRVNGDCEGLRQKELALAAADLFTPGSANPGAINPKPFKPVDILVAPDTTPERVAIIMGRIGVAQVDPRSTS